MKKILCILLISGYFISVSAQQKEFKYELYLGAKGGITFSQVRFYPNVQTSFLEGNTGGLIFRMISEPHIGFQIEFNYIQKGWQESNKCKIGCYNDANGGSNSSNGRYPVEQSTNCSPERTG